MTGVAVASAFPVLAAPSIAAEAATDDPVHGALDVYRKVDDEYGRHIHHGSVTRIELDHNHPDHEAFELRADELADASEAARQAVLKTRPTTPGGAIRLLEFAKDLREDGRGLSAEEEGILVATISDYLRAA